jgi:hypothetical protein
MFNFWMLILPKLGTVDFFLKSSRVDFDASMKITTNNQQFLKIKIRAMFDPADVAGDGEVLWRTQTGTKLET